MRVLQAIEELGYQPHAMARALATRRTRTIALLYPALISEIAEPHLEFVSGILQAANAWKYGLLLWTASEEDPKAPYLVRPDLVDGSVIMEVRLDDPRVRRMKEQNHPFTMIGHCTENEGLNFVDLDFEYALQTCVEYLASLGHRRLAFLNNAEELFQLGVGYMIRSEQAFHRALAQRGLQGISRFCRHDAQAGYEVTRSILSTDLAPTALIILNAWVGGGILRAIQEQGLSVPGDISLVGVFSPRVAEMTVPSLTSIDFPYKTMGYRSAELLLRQLEGEVLAIQEFLQPPLTIRQSSGPCP